MTHAVAANQLAVYCRRMRSSWGMGKPDRSVITVETTSKLRRNHRASRPSLTGSSFVRPQPRTASSRGRRSMRGHIEISSNWRCRGRTPEGHTAAIGIPLVRPKSDARGVKPASHPWSFQPHSRIIRRVTSRPASLRQPWFRLRGTASCRRSTRRSSPRRLPSAHGPVRCGGSWPT